MGKGFGFVKQLVWFTQLGLSVASPLVLGVLGAVWLRNRFGLGAWVVILGVLLGLGGSVSSLWSSLRAMERSAREDDRDGPVGFNDHK